MDRYKQHIYKQAALNSNVTLYPHQQRVVDNPSSEMIVAHSVGSGKTLTGIAKFEKMKEQGQANKALVVVPAGLRTNFGEQGVGKFTDSKYNIVGNKQEQRKKIFSDIDPTADYNIVSYEMFRRNPKHYIEASGADTVIVDEAHRSKTENTQTTNSLKNTRNLYKNYIGLTGSVISNGISDVQPLIDVASGGNHSLGRSKNEFEKMYLKRSNKKEYADLPEKRRPVTGFKNQKMLEDELLKHLDYVDYQDIKRIANMPDKQVHLVKVPLSKEQAKAYKKMLKDDPKIYQLITRKRLETMKNEEIANAFSALIEQRKLMNSANTVVPGMSLEESYEKTPKTKRAIEDIVKHLEETPDGQALLLTHLVNGGVDVAEAGLRKNHIPYGKFIGKSKDLTEEMRQQNVRDFNDRKNKVMIISPAGNEGLSLNDTTFEAVLDPHFNPEKMNQMEARGIRSGGLSHRPKKDRNVVVNRYIATMPKRFGILKDNTPTPDEFIYEIASNKAKNNDMFFKYLKKIRRKAERKGKDK